MYHFLFVLNTVVLGNVLSETRSGCSLPVYVLGLVLSIVLPLVTVSLVVVHYMIL